MQTSQIQIPEPLRAEHAEIHSALVRATEAPGAVGTAARALAALLHAHFEREEEIALPPLALLEPLSQGPPTPDMDSILLLTDALAHDLPIMLQEHQAIGKALDELARVAQEEGAPA